MLWEGSLCVEPSTGAPVELQGLEGLPGSGSGVFVFQADRSGPVAWPWEGVCPSLSPSVLEWGGFYSWRSRVHVCHYAGCLCTSRGHSGAVSPFPKTPS